RGQFAGGTQRVGLSEAGVNVDQDAQAGSEPLPQGLDNLVGKLKLVILDEALRRAEGINFQRVEALADHDLGGLHEVFRRALGAIPAVRITQDRVANPAAEKLVDRHAEMLAEDVPTGYLDSGDHRPVNVPAV